MRRLPRCTTLWKKRRKRSIRKAAARSRARSRFEMSVDVALLAGKEINKMKIILAGGSLALIGAAVFQVSAAETQTYAERLGWEPKARVVMFHCDDLGMSHASNLGGIESLKKKIVNSASIMMTCNTVAK